MNKQFHEVIKLFNKNYKLIPLETFKNNAYKILVSTVLSSRTKDEVTYEASRRLFKIAPNIKRLSELPQTTIRNLIYPVGFYKTKAAYLKKLSNIIIIKYKKIIPNNRKDLLILPGVGRKTANLVLNRAFNKPAIAVDTHVHKIANLLGWIKTKTPRQTENELMKIIPKKYWSKINYLFVSIGRQYNSDRKLKDFLKKNKLLP